MTDDELLALLKRIDPQAVRLPPGIKAVAVAIEAAEREAMCKDVERYRWLRGRVPGGTYRVMGVIYSEGGPGVDAAIDAAMAGQG